MTVTQIRRRGITLYQLNVITENLAYFIRMLLNKKMETTSNEKEIT